MGERGPTPPEDEIPEQKFPEMGAENFFTPQKLSTLNRIAQEAAGIRNPSAADPSEPRLSVPEKKERPLTVDIGIIDRPLSGKGQDSKWLSDQKNVLLAVDAHGLFGKDCAEGVVKAAEEIFLNRAKGISQNDIHDEFNKLLEKSSEKIREIRGEGTLKGTLIRLVTKKQIDAAVAALIINPDYSVDYATVGDCSIVICGPDGKILVRTQKSRRYLTSPHAVITREHLELEPGSMAIVTTDGATQNDIENPYGLTFYEPEVKKILISPLRTQQKADAILDILLKRGRQIDDITMLFAQIDSLKD